VKPAWPDGRDEGFVSLKKQAKIRSGHSPKSLVADARVAVAASPGWNSRLAARRITKFLDAQLEASGLSATQFDLMASIAAASDDTLGALANRLGIDQSTLSRNLQGLEKSGLVEVAAVEKDLRRRAVWLTEKGARALEKAMPLWRKSTAELTRRIDTSLVANLARMTEALESE
jgi:DNA-binding MarR family transcriptional regulator